MPLPTDLLLAMYRDMLRIRRIEEVLADRVTAGEIRTPTHFYIGQEAVAVGVCRTLRPDDYLFGNHRSHGHFLAKGGDLNQMTAEIYGRATGCSGGHGGSMHLVAPEVGILGTVPIVSGTIPLAAGAALASQLRHEDRVTVAFFGDGALEEGTTHETLNFAAHRKLPVIFVCENNFYSSHLQLLERRAQDNIPDIATAHGLAGQRVDGNQVWEVYAATATAVQRARAGAGPTLLECRTYRWRGHVGPRWDLDVGVKRRDELQDWLPKDPLVQLKQQLRDQPLEQIEREVEREIEAALTFAKNSPAPAAGSLMQHVFHPG